MVTKRMPRPLAECRFTEACKKEAIWLASRPIEGGMARTREPICDFHKIPASEATPRYYDFKEHPLVAQNRQLENKELREKFKAKPQNPRKGY